jgi:hypothetical protein
MNRRGKRCGSDEKNKLLMHVDQFLSNEGRAACRSDGGARQVPMDEMTEGQ